MRNFFATVVLTLCLLTGSTHAADAEYLLNNASLKPTYTGLKSCDIIVQQTLAQITNGNMTTYEKVKACYDWLIKNCSYGSNKELFKTPEFSTELYKDYGGAFRARGMLVGRVGVCTDYSYAFAALTRAIGLNCYLVRGQTARATGGMSGHDWCVIKINGVEYVFDPQIDDNIAKGGAIGYYRFCVTYDETPGSYEPKGHSLGIFAPFK